MSAPPYTRPEMSEAEMCNLDAPPKHRAIDRSTVFFDAGPRPQLGTLGDCLEEVACNKPKGFTRIHGGPDAYSCRWPSDDAPELPWLSIDPVTAPMERAPVAIYIAAGTTPKDARRILKLACEWLKKQDSLERFTPVVPVIDPSPF